MSQASGTFAGVGSGKLEQGLGENPEIHDLPYPPSAAFSAALTNG
jgi:hypothetical protein